ncbi:MAG: nuclear transport factor 2 family protein [Saprospiraceae bacterium]|nr:nuclear transport factor 2 family protein [Saprospiraceae bacterium]
MKLYLRQAVCLTLICWLASTADADAQSKDERAIRSIMLEQENAWNRGDLAAFMEGYWKSDSLRFIGSKGLTYGWRQTLENYKKGYPTPDAMGQLKFTILSVEQLSNKSAFVIGKWHLTRKAGDLSGHYTLLWKKINKKWVIVADHSS